MVGIISIKFEVSMVVICVCVIVEISNFSDNDIKMKSNDIIIS